MAALLQIAVPMKTKLLWIIPVAALFSACDQKEDPVASKPKPKIHKSLAERQASKHAETATEEPAGTLEAPASAGSARPLSESVAPPVASASPATPAPAAVAPAPGTPGGPVTQEQLDAYRAKRRAERATEMAKEMTARFKERDANGDGLLAQSEVSERMQRGFGRADANGDGSLDATEQEAMIKAMSDRMTEGGDRERGDRGRGNFAGRRGQGGGGGGGRGQN